MTPLVRRTVVAALATVLASLCLTPVFGRQAWLVPAVGAVLAVVGTAHVLRTRAVARAWVPVGSLVALGCYLVLVYARDQAWLGVLPSRDAVRALLDLGSQGGEEIATLGTPLGVASGIVFLAVVGVGAVAVLVDTLAVTLSRAALAGLPLLGFYLVPQFVTPTGVPWPIFALATGSYLVLLMTDSSERVGRWGRALSGAAARPRSGGVSQTGALAALGRRLGFGVVALAVVLPVLLPGVDRGFLPGEGFGSGNGPSRVPVVNPIIRLGEDLRRPADQEVLRYESSGAGTYLRVVGLDAFDGETWQPSTLKVSKDQNLERPLPLPTGLSEETARESLTTTIDITSLDQLWLPVPYPAAQVDVRGEWYVDGTTANIFSETSTQDLDYTVQHLRVAPSAEQLNGLAAAGPGFEQFLDLPRDLPARVADTAREVTASATTPYEQALALQNWLRSDEFVYSVDAPDANGTEAIIDFLDQRRGYCIHFASTMAVMARTLGIPARVAVGFTAGAEEQGVFTVSTDDTHAWPELYFPTVGWLAFEPTPAVRTGAPPEYAQGEVAAPAAPDEPAPSASAAPAPAPFADRPRDELPSSATDAEDAGSEVPVRTLAGALAALALLATPAALGALARRRRWRAVGTPGDQALAAWGDVRETTRDLRSAWPRSDTPRRTAERLIESAHLRPGPAQAMRRLARAVERAEYAPPTAQAADGTTLAADGTTRNSGSPAPRDDGRTVRTALLTHASRPARLGARWLPAAAGDALQGVASALGEGLGALDRGVTVVTRTLRPRRPRSPEPAARS